jgi:C-terminal processing protease CtpA/Prc
VELVETHTLNLDLRQNGGGNLSLGVRLADHLMAE